MHEFLDVIAPHPPGVDPVDDLLHERCYVVRAYRADDTTLILRGALRDQKPPGLYIADDDEPLTVHHMVVDMTIRVPTLEIIDARAVLETHPHTACPRIEDHYRNLIGLSIARGYTHRVRELFGGPRGCTHTTALLQAMAPVAIQSMWSMRVVAGRRAAAEGQPAPVDPAEARQRALMMNLNTCHVWAEDGEQVSLLKAGLPMEVPVWITRRFAELGRDPSGWGFDD